MKKNSAYAAWTFSTAETHRAIFSVTTGVITGYAKAPILPLLVPSVSIMITNSNRIRFSIVPDTVNSNLQYRNTHVSLEHTF